MKTMTLPPRQSSGNRQSKPAATELQAAKNTLDLLTEELAQAAAEKKRLHDRMAASKGHAPSGSMIGPQRNDPDAQSSIDLATADYQAGHIEHQRLSKLHGTARAEFARLRQLDEDSDLTGYLKRAESDLKAAQATVATAKAVADAQESRYLSISTDLFVARAEFTAGQDAAVDRMLGGADVDSELTDLHDRISKLERSQTLQQSARTRARQLLSDEQAKVNAAQAEVVRLNGRIVQERAQNAVAQMVASVGEGVSLHELLKALKAAGARDDGGMPTYMPPQHVATANAQHIQKAGSIVGKVESAMRASGR